MLQYPVQGLADSGTACTASPPAANKVARADAHGWRVKQHVTAGGTHTRYFVYDAGHRLIERLDNGTATDFVYVGSKPIARRTGSTTTYVHGDEQNSPLFETSSAGAITRQPVYLGYGESDTVGIAEIPGYAGSAPDKKTGINYMGARYYYAYVGRFLSPDPAELDPTTHIGLNRYAYANDNPVRYADSDGWCATDSTEPDAPCPPPPPGPEPDQSTPVPLPVTTVTASTLVASPLSDWVITWQNIAKLGRSITAADGSALTAGALILWPSELNAPSCEMTISVSCGMYNEEQPDERDLVKINGNAAADTAAQEEKYRNAHEAKAGRGGGKVDIYRDKKTGKKWLWSGVSGAEKEKL